MKERILLTGITGFIGRNLAHELLQNGYEVIGLTRNIQKAQKSLKFPVLLYEWKDIQKAPPLEAFKNTTMVVNLAGESIVQKRWNKKQKQVLWDSRVLLTRQLVQAVNLFPQIHTFIQTSAIGYYGDTKEESVDENSKSGSDFMSRLCQAWEKESQEIHKDKRLLILRLGLVLSLNGGLIKKLRPIFKLGIGGKLGTGNQWMSWIHLNDLISIYKTSLTDKSWSGIFNATSPHPVRNSTWTKKLALFFKRPAFLPVPLFALKILYGDGASAITQSQKVLPTRLEQNKFDFQYPNLKF